MLFKISARPSCQPISGIIDTLTPFMTYTFILPEIITSEGKSVPAANVAHRIHSIKIYISFIQSYENQNIYKLLFVTINLEREDLFRCNEEKLALYKRT